VKIAVVGAGRVGGTLGERWAANGHEVVYGVRSPNDRRHSELGSVADPADAARNADVVLLALPWTEVEGLVGVLDLADTIVIDATNPLGASGDVSGAERLAKWAPQARVVKAFNTTGWESMADTAYPGGKAAMLVAGDDARAKEVALALAGELGFEALDAGPLTAARELEALATLWIRLTRSGHGREIAFSLLRR
jgi:predicted dinucleotide-binding enzyme